MRSNKFLTILFFSSVFLFFDLIVISCQKDKDWTYQELRDGLHGEFRGTYSDSTGVYTESYQIIEIDDSISMILGRSFDSTFIGFTNANYEIGVLNMYGSDLLHLNFAAGLNSLSMTKYDPGTIQFYGFKIQ